MITAKLLRREFLAGNLWNKVKLFFHLATLIFQLTLNRRVNITKTTIDYFFL